MQVSASTTDSKVENNVVIIVSYLILLGLGGEDFQKKYIGREFYENPVSANLMSNCKDKNIRLFFFLLQVSFFTGRWSVIVVSLLLAIQWVMSLMIALVCETCAHH